MAAAFLLLPATHALANTVSVTRQGPGAAAAKVTGGYHVEFGEDPTPIDCGSECTASGDNNVFTLTATPAPGDVFYGWGGVSCAGGPYANPCKFYAGIGLTFLITAGFGPVPGPLTATTSGASAVGPFSATLEGQVNPQGREFHECYFEYGETTAYGHVTPCSPDPAAVGDGTTPVPVRAETDLLAAERSFHFRLVASNVVGASFGADHTFTTAAAPPESCANAPIRREQGPVAQVLPDCMAFELVSPPKKAQAFALKPEISLGEGRIRFQSSGALDGTRGLVTPFSDVYVAERGPGGWATSATAPPAPYVVGGTPDAFDPEFGRWLTRAATRSQSGLGVSTAFAGDLSGAWTPISPTLAPVAGGTYGEGLAGGAFQGASADLGDLFFSPAGGTASAGYLPGDPEPAGRGAEHNLYVAGLQPDGTPSVALVARDGTGKAWGANCGAVLGGGVRGGVNQGAVAADGSRTFFTARPAQPEGSRCALANPLRILERVETPSGPRIGEFVASECTRTSPPCSSVDGDDLFEGASSDQRLVYFMTNRQLADTDLDTGPSSCQRDRGESPASSMAGCDLYLYDAARPAGERLTQVSAGDGSDPTPGEGAEVLGVTAVSGDGSHVYFVAKGALTQAPNPQGSVAVAPATGSGTLTSGSDVVTGLVTSSGTFTVGEGIAGPGIPRNATVVAVGGGTLQLSADATISGPTSLAAAAPNLYAYEMDAAHPEGRLAFVGTLDSNCQSEGNLERDCRFLWTDRASYNHGAQAVPMLAQGGPGAGGSGQVLVFGTRAALAPDDTDGLHLDDYRYDAAAATLACVSCADPADGAPLDVSYLSDPSSVGAAEAAERGRWVSEDGDSVVFSTAENLASPDHAAGPESVYLWQRGELSRLAPGSEARVSHSGAEVAFSTYSQLVHRDGDTAADVYVTRAGGGFAEPTAPPACRGEACQAPAAPAAGPLDAGSGQVHGGGNVTPRRSCAKHDRRARTLRRRARKLRANARRPRHRSRSGHRRVTAERSQAKQSARRTARERRQAGRLNRRAARERKKARRLTRRAARERRAARLCRRQTGGGR